MTRCARCGAFVSRYASPTDRYCWSCHPTVEATRTCAHGHDLDRYGVANGERRRCLVCRRARRRVFVGA